MKKKKKKKERKEKKRNRDRERNHWEGRKEGKKKGKMYIILKCIYTHVSACTYINIKEYMIADP